MATILMIGTRKGLWIARSDDRREWKLDGPHHDMEEVYSVLVDTRGDVPRLFAGASSSWLGPQVRWSDDLGHTWQETPNGAIRFPEGAGATVSRIWQLVPGTSPGVLHAGTEPGAVFTSTDGGASFTLEQALWDHPHRAEWDEGFGGQAFHTVLPHPTDPDSIVTAISTGGVYRTTDGGASWHPRNKGIRADFLPEDLRYPEFGQCVHKVARHPDRPERLYAQNHGGVYRSDDEGGSWTDIGEGLPSDFGFPIVVHPRQPDTIWVFPLGGGAGRYPTDARAQVWRSDDAGESWTSYGEGLPDFFHVCVLRDAMCTDDHESPGLYLGARNGSVWASADAGEHWQQVAANLPDVLTVRAATV
ncbi:exo-alpha-sialidase [Nocardioides sp. zg-536]|uniref:Exo-alpha-sialidase n=1 Tax=Nocardioides faecalis TaxID=2803858 RepID=A0A939BXE2_9ACTN|nr:exo-alpha-sialidase [Nocardioides faecalis]MBM9459253.1 exo-alpha-sialidase [Nocardioides faecalis]QVI59614.1 exo-alpha-sialidase [Nocardioides faecalis]